MRWGLGPVFIYECLANSRRWQTFALRSVGVAALLFAMGTIATSYQATTASSWRAYASLGQQYFIALIGVELALVMLAAPAATAGAICLDRARGTLAHMLMTDLSDAEIVLGKLAARLLPVMGLVACTWPVMAISSLLGGIDPVALTLAFAIIVAVAVLGCTVALVLSVWARKSHEVILTTYAVFILGILLWPIWYFVATIVKVSSPPQWTLLANPFYVAFAPYADPGKLDAWDYLIFFGAMLLASSVLTLLAVWRTRPVACRGSVEKSMGTRVGLTGRITRWLPGPSLDRSPVLWREWHRSRPSRWMTAILALFMGTTVILCIAGAVGFWKNGANPRPGATWEVAGICSYVLHVSFGLLMLAAIAPTSMAEERQRGSLDILAATTLSTRAIVIGKWLGTFRLVWLMTIGPGLIALAMATAWKSPISLRPGMASGMPPDWYRVIPLRARYCGVVVVIATIIAHGALITSVGVALAVWVKRQSRAIAMSVGSFILVAAAWPFAVSFPLDAELGRNLASLSPVVLCSLFVNYFTNRSHRSIGGMLATGGFWAVEVFVLAMGLLWLTVVTFDRCFDRIPDRTGRLSLVDVAVVILGGMIGAGSLVWAADCWIAGFQPAGTLSGPLTFGIVCYSLLLAIGLVLIAVETARSGRSTWSTDTHLAPGIAVRSFVLGRWWKSFRLVLLLAVGPALLATALATAQKPPRYEPQFTTNASGAQVITSYIVVRSDIPVVGEALPSQRLMIAALLVVTILAHGGAAISVGEALAVAHGRSKRAVVAMVGAVLVAAFVQPLSSMLIYRLGADTAFWSFVTAADTLLATLIAPSSFTISKTLWAAFFWDVILTIFAAVFTWGTIKAWWRPVSATAKSNVAPVIDLLSEETCTAVTQASRIRLR